MKKKQGRQEKTYVVVDEANTTIKKLMEKYPKILRSVQPEKIIVLGIENDPPTWKNWMARIKKINNPIKTILEKHQVKAEYIIELYLKDWDEWTASTRGWVLFHELLHIPSPDKNGLWKHNVEDFSIIIDKIGANGYESESIPNLLGDKSVDFDDTLILKEKEKVEKEK